MSSVLSIAGKSALVTGGGSGIGRMIAGVLVSEGARTYIVGRNARTLDETARVLSAGAGECIALPGDLSTVAGARAVADALAAREKSLDILVNNAGTMYDAPIDDFTEEGWDSVVDLNLKSVFFLTQALLPLLRNSGAGCVINITDMAVTHAYTTTHFFAHYLASKAALDQLTRAWALELGPAVRVNAVAPGPVAIGGETTEEQRADILRRVPLRREGSPEDIATAVLFLARSPYITGQTIRVDGGLSVA